METANRNSEKQVSTKQLVMIVFVVGMSIKMFMLPVLMLKVSGRDSYLAMGACLVGELLCLGMLLITGRLAPDQTFFQLLESVFRKVGAKIVTVLFAFYFFVKLLLLIGEVKIFFTAGVYENLPWPVYVIPLLAVLAAMGAKSLRALSRTAEIFAPLVGLSVVVMCVLLMLNVDYGNLLPVLEFGFGRVADSVLNFPMWYGDFSVLVLFLGNVKRTRHTGLAVMLSGVVSAVVVLFFSVTVFAAYANVGDMLQYGQNLSSLTQLTLTGYNLGRFDILIFAVWMISVFIKAAVLFSAAVRSGEYVTGRSCPYWSSLIFAAAVYVFAVFVFPNEAVFHGMAIDLFALPALIMQFAVPLVVLICAVVRFVRENKRIDGGKPKRRLAKTGTDASNGEDAA